MKTYTITVNGNVYNVTVEEGALVEDSIIMPGTVIKSGAKVQYAIVAENSVIDENAQVGARPEDVENLEEWGVAVVGSKIKIGKNCTVLPKEQADSDREV